MSIVGTSFNNTSLMHKLIFTNLTLKNFLSVGNVTQAIRLSENGLTLILGANTDANGGLTRNGAGKSTILQAISYAIYGKPLTKIKIPNLINNINGKDMLVTIEFERDGKVYRIERGKKKDILRFYVNGEEQKDETDAALGENRHTQEEIERIIGMSHTMFKHIVALNTFTDPFLKMGAGDQKAVIEELLSVTKISHRAEALSKLIKSTKETIRNLEAKIKATTEANDRINLAIQRAETQVKAWDAAREKRVLGLAEELAQIETIDFEVEIAKFDALDAWLANEKSRRETYDAAQREISLLEREAAALDAEAKRYRAEIEKGVEDEVRRLQAAHKRDEAAQRRHYDAAQKFGAELEQVLADIANADGSECVCCGQQLQGTDHLKTVVANLEKKRDELSAKIDEEHRHAFDISTNLLGLDHDIQVLRDEHAVKVEELTRKADAKKAEADTVRDKEIEWAQVADDALRSLNALGDKPVTAYRTRDDVYRARQARDGIERELEAEVGQTNPHINQITELEKALQPIDYEPLNEATSLFKHQDFLFKLLSDKGSFIRKKIIDQNLSYLNSRLNYYLDKLGLPHEVQFQSDLTVDITNLGRDFDFEQLSRGEMNRVIMATSWSFRDIWESTNVGCNLLWVDELLDQGTDGQGVEAALSILKGMARERGKNVFLISHREELQARIDRTLLVRKENGFTTLEADGVTHE